MIIELNSVGCVIDTETNLVYAKYSEESRKVGYPLFDKDSGIPLNECSDEFIDLLTDDEVYQINENSNYIV